jgi:hypothetical protein
MYDKKTETFMDYLDNESFMLSSSGSYLTLPISQLSQAINKYWPVNNNKSLYLNDRDRTFIQLNDFNNLFYSWKQRLEQFKLLMQIKHNSFGFVWSNSIMLKKQNELEFLKINNRTAKAKEKRLTRHHHHHHHHQKQSTTNKIKEEITNTQDPLLIQEQLQNTFDMIDETDYSYLKLKFDEKDCFETFLTNNSNINNNNNNNISSSDDIFTSKSMFASLINDPFCQSFFSHNEINITQMLDSGNETGGGVSGLFSDDLAKLDLSLS